jgi:hypothetical protein
MLSAVKAFQVDGLPPVTATKRYKRPRNAVKTSANVKIPRFGHHAILIKY